MSKAKIYYYDIGDYLSREEKLKIIQDFKSMSNLPLKVLKPNEHGDWLNQRNDIFETFIPMAPEKKFDMKTQSFFNIQGPGILTSRDIWVYGFCEENIKKNIKSMIDFYNIQVANLKEEKIKNKNVNLNDIIDLNPQLISWTRALKKDLERNTIHSFQEKSLTIGYYRPFCKQNLYYDKSLTESPGLNQIFFPSKTSKNVIISIPGIGSTKKFNTLISNCPTDYQVQFNNQCFPLYYYEEREKANPGLFDAAGDSEYVRRDGVSDFILERAKKQYGKNVTKEDIFYYVYGILHSEDYRNTFENDLKKMLPRLPLVEDVRDFWKFSKAGRKLAELHLNYEEVPHYEGVEVSGASEEAFQLNPDLYKVQKMRFPKRDQKDKIIYNSKIVLNNIPEKAYEYVVNGKSAIEWIMDRYQVKTDKKSGITNDPNDWAKEHDKPRYILDLLLSIINVSVQTMDIVESLPKLDFDKETEEDVL